MEIFILVSFGIGGIVFIAFTVLMVKRALEEDEDEDEL